MYVRVLQRLDTAKSLLVEDLSLAAAASEDGMDFDEGESPRHALQSMMSDGAAIQRANSEIMRLKSELKAVRRLNVDLQQDLEAALVLVDGHRESANISPAVSDGRPSPSLVLIDSLTSAMANWKGKAR